MYEKKVSQKNDLNKNTARNTLFHFDMNYKHHNIFFTFELCIWISLVKKKIVNAKTSI